MIEFAADEGRMNFIADVDEVPDHSDVLLLDFHGTVSDGLLWGSLDPSRFGLIQRVLFERRPDLVSKWMLGQVDAETITRFVAVTTGISYRILWNSLIESAMSLRPAAHLEHMLAETSKVINVGLLTGNMDTLHRFTLSDPLRGISFVASTNILGQSKEEFLKRLSEQSRGDGKIYLVDDSANVVELARGLGIGAMQTRSLDHTVELLGWLSSSLETQKATSKRRAA